MVGWMDAGHKSELLETRARKVAVVNVNRGQDHDQPALDAGRVVESRCAEDGSQGCEIGRNGGSQSGNAECSTVPPADSRARFVGPNG
jgi:hypothetical protein